MSFPVGMRCLVYSIMITSSNSGTATCCVPKVLSDSFKLSVVQQAELLQNLEVFSAKLIKPKIKSGVN